MESRATAGFPIGSCKRACPNRSNDPATFASSDVSYKQIGQQVKGLMFGKTAARHRHANRKRIRAPWAQAVDAEHILKLKRLAIAAGLDVPLYTVTGWADARLSAPGEVIAGFWRLSRRLWDA